MHGNMLTPEKATGEYPIVLYPLTFTNKRLKNSGYLSFTERYTQVTNF